MKKFSLLILVFVFAGLTYLNQSFDKDNQNLLSQNSDLSDTLDCNSYEKVKINTKYKISAELDTKSSKLLVSEIINWKNNSEAEVDEIFLHLYANALKSKKTIYLREKETSQDIFTSLNISSVYVNNQKSELSYFNYGNINHPDSTVAKVKLQNKLNENDSVKIQIEYQIDIPNSNYWLGHTVDKEFFFLSNWFPKVAVFENEVWKHHPFYPYAKTFSEFADYEVKLKIPLDYNIISSGEISEKSESDGSKTLSFKQDYVNGFTIFASKNIYTETREYLSKSGEKISIKAFIQPVREFYIDRYFKAVENGLEYLEDKLGHYPYESITIVDVPRYFQSKFYSYPKLLTINAQLLSPQEYHEPEKDIINQLTSQYLACIISNDGVNNAWLDEGLSSYLTTKILNKYYGKGYLSFKIANYLPIAGINYLSFNGIPLVYTLKEYPYEEGTLELVDYYKNDAIGSIDDNSYELPNELAYKVNSKVKPELILSTLENILGDEQVLSTIADYFKENAFDYSTDKYLIESLERCDEKNVHNILDYFIKGSYRFDYRIKNIDRVNQNEYHVMCERLGDGIFKNKVALYTENDTLIKYWSGKETYKTVSFTTDEKVYGAEIDPDRVNLLDVNFANNSYTMEAQYLVTFSLSLRWLFWVQNMLMVLGSIG